MPYRRLPTTDQARKRALSKALEMGSTIPLDELAFSPETYEKIKTFSNEFENALSNYKSCMDHQVERNKGYAEIIRKARLYISHFIQVMNLAISREELDSDIREYYGFHKENNVVPALNIESEILKWGELIIEGEQKRISNGGNPIYGPSVAIVKVHFSAFKDAQFLQKTLQANTNRALEKIATLRNSADKIIKELWNEIELHYQFLTPIKKREKAKDYGIIYVYRKNELENSNQEELQTNLIFEM